MAFKYRNMKTGEVITTTNRVGGKNWEQVEDPTAHSFEEETHEEEAVADEAPAEKPKTTRRGKK